jgi:Ca-activated chloride channel family protein
VQIPIKVIDKEAIKKKIDGIVPRSATNLWGGCAKGYEYVLKNYREGFINRVLLISDGLANVGVVDPKIIHLKVQQFKDDNGVTLSTFGVGLDYNEMLMTDMAETGAGNYYFIDNPSTMTSIFARELNGLLDVTAQNAELKIKIPAGVKIQKGYPLKYTQEGDEVTIKLRDLFSEETKGIVFNFSIPNRTNTVLKFITTLSYTDVSDGQKRSLRNENVISPVKSQEAYLTHFNKPVIEQTILYTANENLEKAMAKVDKGDFDGANDEIQRGNKYLKTYSNYTKTSEELRRMDSITKAYATELSSMQGKNADSVKKIQKVNRDLNYKLRQKKQ